MVEEEKFEDFKNDWRFHKGNAIHAKTEGETKDGEEVSLVFEPRDMPGYEIAGLFPWNDKLRESGWKEQDITDYRKELTRQFFVIYSKGMIPSYDLLSDPEYIAEQESHKKFMKEDDKECKDNDEAIRADIEEKKRLYQEGKMSEKEKKVYLKLVEKGFYEK